MRLALSVVDQSFAIYKLCRIKSYHSSISDQVLALM